MKSKRITFNELCNIIYEHNKEYGKEPLEAVIVFKQESFDKPYSELSRSYAVCSETKYFQPRMGGNSLYGNCLDGSDNGVRLDWYMFGDKPWLVDYCYLTNDWKFETYDQLIAQAKTAGEAFVDSLDALALSKGNINAREDITKSIETILQHYVGGTLEA